MSEHPTLERRTRQALAVWSARAAAREAERVPVQPGQAHKLARAALDVGRQLLVVELEHR